MLKKPASKIQVLIVDDSPLIREMIADAIRKSHDLEVIGEAGDGLEAVQQVQRLQPDVITLDVEMPRLSGLEALERILQVSPTPAVMFSSLTERAAGVTLEALDRGAVDYIAKPSSRGSLQQVLEFELLHKLRVAAAVDVKRLQARPTRPTLKPNAGRASVQPSMRAGAILRGVVGIGISTGGPPVLTQLFQELTPPMPPILVVQHMPEAFTGPFSRRLDQGSALTIKEAEDGDRIQNDHVYVARGGHHLELVRHNGINQLRIFRGDPVAGHQPSVDVMMTSVAQLFGRKSVGVIMTGMGRDGVEGCRSIYEAGGRVLGQDQSSSAVYGMNKIAKESGWVHQQFSLEQAVDELLDSIASQIGAPFYARSNRITASRPS